MSLRIINVEMTHLDIQVCVCVFENNKCGNDTLRYSDVCVRERERERECVSLRIINVEMTHFDIQTYVCVCV